jgi:hypothetical protein
MRMMAHPSARFLRADGGGAGGTPPRHRPHADVKHAHGVHEHRAARMPRAVAAGHGCHSVTPGRRAPCLHDVGPRRHRQCERARRRRGEPLGPLSLNLGGWLTGGPQHFRGFRIGRRPGSRFFVQRRRHRRTLATHADGRSWSGSRFSAQESAQEQGLFQTIPRRQNSDRELAEAVDAPYDPHGEARRWSHPQPT